MRLKDGTTQSGVVVELGGNRIELRIANSARTILKRDVDSVEFDRTRPASTVEASDAVVKKSGHVVRGPVELLDGGQKVQVTLAGGARAVFPRQDVARIIKKGDVVKEDPTVFTVETGEAIDVAVEKLTRSADKESEQFLVRCGILAIARVAEALRQAPAAGAGREALERVVKVHQLKSVVATGIEASEPRIYEILGYGSEEEKCGLLLFVFPRHVEESVALAQHLASDAREASTIRAWAVDFLRRMQKNRELLEIYRRSTGQVQLATAIALGHNRVLVGLPAIIEALELDSPEVRTLAFRSLRDFTNLDFGFDPSGAPQARKNAVGRARAWWQQNEPRIVEAAQSVLRANAQGTEVAEGEPTAERREAVKLWSEAGAAVDSREYAQAESLLRRALHRDSTFFQAHLALAVVLYTFADKHDEAIRGLEELKTKRLPGVTVRDRQWIFVHLGNAKSLRGDHAGAADAYEEAKRIAPDNLYALSGLVDAAFQQATRDGKLDLEERKEKLKLALEAGRHALATLEKSSEDLVALSLDSIALSGELPFDRRDYNRAVLDLRKTYRRERKELAFKVAKLLSLLGDKKEAVLTLRDVVEPRRVEAPEDARKLEANIRCYLGVLYEDLHQPVAALREYRRVLEDIDAQHGEARRGVERLQRPRSDRASN